VVDAEPGDQFVRLELKAVAPWNIDEKLVTCVTSHLDPAPVPTWFIADMEVPDAAPLLKEVAVRNIDDIFVAE
jgi:hypothetical protein